jgi:hypothetical protein
MFGRLRAASTRTMTRIARWLFASPTQPVRLWKVIVWWELRRIPFNLIIGAYGLLSLAVFFWAITSSGRLGPGEDAVEPMALMAAPFRINLLYTLGWLVEGPARLLVRDLSPRFGPALLALGLAMGLFFSTVPAALWVGVRVLQGIGFTR